MPLPQDGLHLVLAKDVHVGEHAVGPEHADLLEVAQRVAAQPRVVVSRVHLAVTLVLVQDHPGAVGGRLGRALQFVRGGRHPDHRDVAADERAGSSFRHSWPPKEAEAASLSGVRRAGQSVSPR